MARSLILGVALVLGVAACGEGSSLAPSITAPPMTAATTTSSVVGTTTTSAATTTFATATTAATATTSATTTTAAATDIGLAWSRVPHDEAVLGGPAGQRMNSVVAGGPGLVAVGGDRVWFGNDAAVWTSVDGLVWSRVPHDEAVFGGPNIQVMNSVVAGGPGLVAVGWDGTVERPAAAVWTSIDGTVWSRVPYGEEVFGPRSVMNSVVAGGPGLVAVGSAASGGSRVPAVWTSADGMAWSRVPHGDEVFGPRSVMNSVVAGVPGLVAVGSDSSRGDVDAAVWTSVDGLTWSRVPHDEEVFGGPDTQVMRTVAAGGPGLVGVGHEGEYSIYVAAVWTSADGLVWSRVPHDEELFGGENDEHVMSSVVAGGPGWIAVGWAGLSGGEVAALWVSPPQP